MRFLGTLANIKTNKTFQTLLKILFALFISVALSVIFIIYTPSIFTPTLNYGLKLLPKNKFIEYKIQTKEELAQQWLASSDALKDDVDFFDHLRANLPNTRSTTNIDTNRQDTFFAHMFIVHDYPAPCYFTIFGKHRTIDITWTIKGIRCKGAKQCSDPTFIEECPARKKRHR